MDDLQFGGPATYRILVQGRLDERWVGRLGSLSLTSIRREGEPHTSLSGQVRDQAELWGILDSLHGQHLPILRVERVDEDEPPAPVSAEGSE